MRLVLCLLGVVQLQIVLLIRVGRRTGVVFQIGAFFLSISLLDSRLKNAHISQYFLQASWCPQLDTESGRCT